ncbi:MAG: TonB-dependent receptor [Ignavibacteria bacterium]
MAAAVIKILVVPAFLCTLIHAQNKTITGIVKDHENNPIPFANVFLMNTPDGTMSEEDGKFSFKTSINNNVTLTVSMVGYEKYFKEINLSSSEEISAEIILKENAVKLNETIVTASSYGSEKEKGLVINRMDVLTTPGGAADIYQSLKTMPGITQVSESAELYVRGGDPIETITMINQSVIYHPFTFESAYGGIFSSLDQSAVKSMYFTSGGFSSKYGNALSGVLDIETKNQPANTNASFGLSLANVNIAADIAIVPEKFGLYFDARQNFTKPIFWLNGGLDRLAAAPNSKSFTGGAVYNYSETGKLKLFTILADDEQGVRVERAEYNGMFNGNSKNLFINLQATDIFFGNMIIKNSIAYNKYSNSWLFGILNITKTDYVYLFRSDLEFIADAGIKILGGAEFENRKASYTGEIPLEDYDIRPESQSKKINAEFEGFHYGLYAEIQSAGFLGIQKLSGCTGLRFDNFIDLNTRWIDPRASLGYKLNEKNIFRLGWGIYKQIPDPRLFNPSDGNPGLKPMRADHTIISYEYLPDELNSFRIEAYQKTYKNLPMENDELNYDNSGCGFARGIDVIYKGVFPFGINGWISYGYINTKRKWMDSDIYTSSSFDITHNFALVAKYNLSGKFQLGLTAKYATGRPYTPVISSNFKNDLNIFEPVYAAVNSSRFPHYKRIDLRLTYFGNILNNYSLVAYIEGINILNFTNIFGYSYSPNYENKKEIKSFFGRRMVVVGLMVGI